MLRVGTRGRTMSDRLKPGLYRIYWKDDGGVSLAAVGCLSDGTNWMAPTNWTSSTSSLVATSIHWDQVERVEPIVEAPSADDWYEALALLMRERAPA